MLWDMYLKLCGTIYSNDDWNDANEEMRRYYSGQVVRKLIKTWPDGDITKLCDMMYSHGHKREYEILKEMGY